MPLACFAANRKLSTHHPTCRRHVPTLWRYRFEKFDTTSYQEIILSLGFFRRETASGFYGSEDKYWGHRNKKHKKTAFCRCQCFAPAVSAVACLISSWGLNQPHHTPNAALLRGRWHRQKDKNRSPSAKNQTRLGRDNSRPPTILILY